MPDRSRATRGARMFRWIAVLLAAGSLGALASACDEDPPPAEECTDGVDNDGDGLADCADPDCSILVACNPEVCTDDFDNDGNGLTDCEDPACSGDPMVCPPEACEDGVDNDDDGLVDCDDTEDCAEASLCIDEVCDDGMDNDNDGDTDCADDECAMLLECQPEQCDDAMDNDGDMLVDCEDDDCATDAACTAGCTAPDVFCESVGGCTEIVRDPNHCGGCDNACADDEVCNGVGECGTVCEGTTAACDGACVELLSDEDNCGACGNVCPTGDSCEGGFCTGVCGDGSVSQNEVCDGASLGGETCATRGFADGTLGCLSDCSNYDATQCYVCGNNTVRPNTLEVCDGNDLSGETCVSRGFTAGSLGCAADCLGYDESGCTTCGDGTISGAEACEAGDLNGATCESLGFDAGTLACNANTCGYDTSGCTFDSCPNGAIDPPEDCDGFALGGASCASLGFDGGQLACQNNCIFDTSACFSCGDDTTNGTEFCDGNDLNGVTCTDLGFAGGNLGCNAACSDWDTSNCTVDLITCPADDAQEPNDSLLTAAPIAPGVIEGIVCGQDEDWFSFMASTGDTIDIELGFAHATGDLDLRLYEPGSQMVAWSLSETDGERIVRQVGSANAGAWSVRVNRVVGSGTEPVRYDLDLEVVAKTCGNGIAEADEACDGAALRGSTCNDLGYADGTLGCNAGCTGFDVSQCGSAEVCGNGAIEGGERCDGANLDGETCQSLGFTGGVLGCTPGCVFDTFGCGIPAGWTCDPAAYASGDGCDCGCGAPDPDCDSALGAACDTCNGTGSCDQTGNGCQGIIVPNDNTQCLDFACGDNVADPTEACDGPDLGGVTCGDFGLNPGTITCNAACTGFDTSLCGAAPSCGNGAAEPGESCDGGDLAGATCANLGFQAGGTLACTGSCGFDTSGCTVDAAWTCPAASYRDGVCDCGCGIPDPDCVDAKASVCDNCNLAGSCDGTGSGCPGVIEVQDNASCRAAVCGNNVVDPGEVCDGVDLAAETCVTQGAAGGILACAADCQSFVLTGCNQCGDGQLDPGEVCDGTNLDNTTCESINAAWTGTLGCNADCTAFNTIGCCGDGVAAMGEECDGFDFKGETCDSQDAAFGNLTCTATCTIDNESCNFCGNGVLEPARGELCDLTDVGTATCANTVGPGSTGTLLCNATCNGYFTVECCGDGVRGVSEICDGGDLNGQNCSSQGKGAGPLSCAPSCDAFLIDQCFDYCGNDVVELMEVCDGTDLDGEDCVSQGFAGGGTLGCDTACAGFDTSGCTL